LKHPRAPVRVARDQLPVDVVLEGPGEQHDQPHRVGAPALDDRHRLDDVALRLGHRGAAVDHLALVHQPWERLDEPDHPHVVQRLGEEPAVQQVQDRVLDPAGVLVGRHPPVDVLATERAAVVRGEQYRKKYQLESTNVSIVSVSRSRPRHRSDT
jgi:hypothetical protein